MSMTKRGLGITFFVPMLFVFLCQENVDLHVKCTVHVLTEKLTVHFTKRKLFNY